MAIGLTPLSQELDHRPHAIILLSTHATEDVRQALWTVLGACP